MSAPENPPHGTAIAIDGRGVLITGAPGAGKTALALSLIGRARAGGYSAGLVADDRVLLTATGNGVTAACPPPIAGKVEIRGWGVVEAPEPVAGPVRLALIVRLVPADQALRFAVDHREEVAGREMPALRLPEGPAPTAATAVFAALGLPVWL